MRVYIGHDEREVSAFLVCVKSLRRHSPNSLALPLYSDRLRRSGMLRRPVDARGRMYDIVSQAEQSTEFAISRFLVPMLAQTGWALFVDCDVIFHVDVDKILAEADCDKAVHVVKHHYYTPAEAWKMDGRQQLAYPRKNWSSVVLWNCDHPANQRLTLDAVNNWPGRDLHAFCWLHDSEIGDLCPGWNWLVNVQPEPPVKFISHFTLGGPWLPNWHGADHDDLWTQEEST